MARDRRLETKISETTRRQLDYLIYVYDLKYDNRVLEKLINDAYIKEKKNGGL